MRKISRQPGADEDDQVNDISFLKRNEKRVVADFRSSLWSGCLRTLEASQTKRDALAKGVPLIRFHTAD